MRISICLRCKVRFLFEKACEMLLISESELLSHFTDLLSVVTEHDFRFIDHGGLNMIQCRSSGFFFDQVTKIVVGKMELIGAVTHRGYA
ncbi:hypothetical protein D3C87_1971990 [compost metagenome]